MEKFKTFFSIQFILLFFGLMVSLASAQTFEVSRTDDPTPDGCSSGTDCSLREAIIAANDVGSGSATIQLMGGQTYTLSIVNATPEDDFDSPDETAGSLKILNTVATVRIEATGSGMATIDADGIDRVFTIYAGTDVEIDEIVITGGDPENGRGGGIFVFNNSNLEITNSSITGNTAINSSGFGYAGGIWAEGVNMIITGSTISNNSAGFQGGGIRITRYNEEVTVNSDVTIENSTISNNDGDDWSGGIHTERSDLTIIESTISGNQGSIGGGIRISSGNIIIDRSTIDNNIGSLGGGLDIDGGEVFIINSTISGNEAENFNGAGGIYAGNFSDAVIDIVNTTITNNKSGTIGGVIRGMTGSEAQAVINFTNSIVANQDSGDDCSGTINSNGNNLSSDETCGFTQTGDLQNSDPLLGPLQDNGGPVFTHAISSPLSPAVNNGSNTLYTSEGGGDLANDSDANGNDRVYDFASGGIIDIGSFELQQDATFDGCPVTNEEKILFVKKGESGTGANWADALGELRDALALFEDETCTAADVEEIWVSAGTYLPTDDTNDREATFLMPGVDILGGFEGDETNDNQRDVESNISILSGDINDDDNLSGNSFHVVTSMDEGSAGLFDFTITGGNADGTAPHDKGGGLYASNGGITMADVLFENNYAETAGGGAWVIETVNRIGAQHPAFVRTAFRNNETGQDGGGLALEDSESRMTAVTFENNTANRYGGGLFNDGADPVLKNVIFKENYADLEGGGILNTNSSPELFNVLVINNDANVNGGGIVNAVNASPVLTNVTISGNSAGLGNGGGMYNRNVATPTLINTIVWGNMAGGTGNEIWNSSNSTAVMNFSLYGDDTGDIVEGDGFTANNSTTSQPNFTDNSSGDFTLQGTSPAINTGDPDTEMSDFKLFGPDEIDLAENPRVYNGNPDPDYIDIGAYEFQGEPTEEPEFAPFITTWEVEAGDLEITIPTAAGPTYNYDVDWGDGESDTGQTGDASHTYDSANTYTVKITGTFPQIEFFEADDKDKILSVEQWGEIEWASMRKAFQGATNLVINASDAPDLSNATSMLQMFTDATSVNGGLENWDVSTIESMFGLFDGATSFNGDISGWTVTEVTDMIRMFAGATSFNRDIGGWAVDKVNSMESMFDGATSFNQDLSEWNTGMVGGMGWMFNGATAFNQDLGDWDISMVTGMSGMLDGSGLSTENYDNTLIGWAAQTVQEEVELGADGLTYCNGADARDMLTGEPNSWDITGDSEATGCGAAEFAPFITTWKTDNPGISDDLSIRIPMIGNGYDFNVDWGDGNVEDYNTNPGDGVEHFLEHTYTSAGEYEVKIIGDFPRIFFNNGGQFVPNTAGDHQKIVTIEQWGDIQWSSMEEAFEGASNLTYMATDTPDLSGVTSMVRMFQGAKSFNGDIGDWNVSTITSMRSLFLGADIFNQDIGYNPDTEEGWDMSSVTDVSLMFDGAASFNQDISGWNVSNVTKMVATFYNATSFNQDLGDWDVSNVSNMLEMFDGSGLSTENYDNTLISWAALAENSGVQSEVELGAVGLTYCAGADARDTLMGEPHNWEIIGDAVSETCGAFRPFITTWEVEAGDLSINFSTSTSVYSYDYDIDWGDGKTDTGVTGDASHTYDAAGTYIVKITGIFPTMNYTGDYLADKLMTVEQWGDIEWKSMYQAFFNASSLEVNAIDTPDLSNVESLRRMFHDASSMTGANANWDWDTSNITNMGGMFSGAGLFNQDISSWNTSNVVIMHNMFHGASSFNQDISGWITGNVIEMFNMFRDASSFNQNFGGWDIQKVTDMRWMLDGSGLSTANYDATLTGWAGQTVQSDVELGADGLTYCEAEADRQSLISDDSWDILGDDLAESCGEFRPFITTWKTDNGGDSDDQSIRIPMIGNGYDFNVDWGDGSDENYNTNPGDGVTHFVEHTYASTGEYDVKITGDFSRIYLNNEGDKEKLLTIEQWGDVAWTSMNSAFKGGANLTYNATDAPDLSAVSDMHDMFFGASSFNGNLNGWDVSGVINMESVFQRAISFTGDLNSWDVSSVETMKQMFYDADTFNGDISSWNVSNVASMRLMFREAFSFNGDLNSWDVSSVTDMTAMFDGATSFNQDLSNWNVSNVESLSLMLKDTGLSTENYDATLTGWAGQTVQNGLTLGANGLTYCEAEDDRQSLIDDHNWTISDDGLAGGCTSPEGEDQRIFVSNASDYEFSSSDFGISNDDFSILIESLPDEGTLELGGSAVNLDDEISIEVINNDDFTWDMPAEEYGYNFTSFDFRILDQDENQSDNVYTLTIDLGTVFTDLSGSEGWRFMTNPSDGDSYFDLFSGITVDLDFPNRQSLYELDQPNYEWDPVGSTGDEPGVGAPFIIYVLGEDLPVTVQSGENWEDLDGSYSYSGLEYDGDGASPNPGNFYLLGNPHPIALDFCEFIANDIATSAYFWEPNANGGSNPDTNAGNGDYIDLNCAAPDNVLIAPFQSFWVRTTDSNPSLDIPTEAYLESTTDGYFKESSEDSETLEDLLLISFTVTGEEGLFTNQAKILFKEDAKQSLDRYDAPKLSAEGLAEQWLSFYSMDADGRAYAFQSIPTTLLNEEKVRIPMDIQTTESGPFTLDWTLPESHIFSGSYYLRDNQTGDVVELRKGSSYKFEIDDQDATKVNTDERSAKSLTDFAVLGADSSPRFELLIAGTGIDGFTELGAVPETFTLAQNYPNPFNPTTVINYQLPASSQVRLEVYDITGRQVATLVNGQVAAGRHTVNFDASNLSSGVYLYRLVAGSQIMTKKLTILK